MCDNKQGCLVVGVEFPAGRSRLSASCKLMCACGCYFVKIEIVGVCVCLCVGFGQKISELVVFEFSNDTRGS